VRKDITALVADKYKKYPIFNWMLDIGGGVWLDRSKADFGAFRLAADCLKQGVCLGIAPEGTRSTTGQLQEGKPGIVMLAQKTGVPVVPVGISGTETYYKNLLRLRRPIVKLTFGPAFQVPPLDRNNRDESLKQSTDEIMARIAVLLPEKYRGFYKDHPRVRELLSEKV
jgi:1-acyl-sn-glycerol-3-phosphate acyltransferase